MEFSYADMDNTNLEAHARNLHGALYRRINTLQRDLNIARETNKRYQDLVNEYKIENNDLRKLVKSKEDELRELRKTSLRTDCKPLFPETPKPIVYKLEPLNDILTQEVIYRLVPKE